MPFITINTKEGASFEAYVAKPASGGGPGMLLIQEIFGVNEGIRRLADELAASGYVVAAPDLFWRIEPRIALDRYTPEERQKAFGYLAKFDVDAGVSDLVATIGALRGMPECTGRVGALGYCLGGHLAYLTLARANIDCAVAYYGVGVEKNLDEASRITRPLLMHFGDADEAISPEARQRIVDALGGNPHVTIRVYPGAGHAFARIGGKNYDADAAKTANLRTAEFLRQHLASSR